MRLINGISVIVLFALIPRFSQAQAKRGDIVPLVDHHQHIVGPAAVAFIAPEPSPPDVSLPPDLKHLIDRRQAAAANNDLSVFSRNAMILDVSEGEDHWVRGPDALSRMLGAYQPRARFIAKSYSKKATTGFIAGVVRTDTSSIDEMHFMFGLEKDAGGAWRIAVESATNKPPLEYPKPLTAEKTIQVLDDAGIGRAVVLSVAYWFGDGEFKGTIDQEYAKVREENDWMAQQISLYPARLVGFCGINPIRPYAIQELERCSRLPGVKGMKLHFGNAGIDAKNPQHVQLLRRFFRRANERKMAIVAHLWIRDRSYGREHARIFLDSILPEAPDVTVQIAHMGGAGRYAYDDVTAVFADAISAGDPRMKNVYFDLATVVTERQSAETLTLIARRLRQIGLSKILFGADTPVPHNAPPIQAWATFRRRMPLTDDELRVIAGNVAPYLK